MDVHDAQLAAGDFEDAFREARRRWMDGEHRRSLLICILAHMLVSGDYEMLDSLDEHADEPVLLSLGFIRAGRPGCAVALMKTVQNEDAEYLHALLAVHTRSVHLLDYAMHLHEDVLVRTVEAGRQSRFFGNVVRCGCEYVDGKILRVAERTLDEEEYRAFVDRFNGSEEPHRCIRMCRIGMLRREMHVERRECAQGRYSEMRNVLESLEEHRDDQALGILKEMYGASTTEELDECLANRQNIAVLTMLSRCTDRSDHYLSLCRRVHCSHLREKFECLVGLLDAERIVEAADLLDLDLMQ